MENVIDEKVLDHGYLKVIETWGSDQRIVEAARMSTDKGFQGWGPKHSIECPLSWSNPSPEATCMCYLTAQGEPKPGDEKLLKFLWDNKHATPFEMAGMIIEVQAPIFVFREWHRHRTQSYNELSARYTTLPDLYYVPSIERLMNAKQSTTNKQSSAAGFNITDALCLQNQIETIQTMARQAYEQLLAQGVSREVARVVIPVSQYSRMRASANLRNWLAFLTLRMDEKAQYEIRQYANVLGEHIAQAFPQTWNLFNLSH